MRAYIVSVDYTDILRQTLPLMRHHFTDVMVITSHRDADAVARVCREDDASIYVTDAFYRNGAIFNKFLALEEAFERDRQRGWLKGFLCILDADIVWPKIAPLNLVRGKLYSPYRYMYPEVNRIPPESEWERYPIHKNLGEHAGYTQIFHADDPVLGEPPWHEVNWSTAGGPDSFFQRKWKREDRIRPDWYALHIGPAGANWAGRVSAYADGSVPPDADEKTAKLRRLMDQRRKNGNFTAEKLGGGL